MEAAQVKLHKLQDNVRVLEQEVHKAAALEKHLQEELHMQEQQFAAAAMAKVVDVLQQIGQGVSGVLTALGTVAGPGLAPMSSSGQLLITLQSQMAVALAINSSEDTALQRAVTALRDPLQTLEVRISIHTHTLLLRTCLQSIPHTGYVAATYPSTSVTYIHTTCSTSEQFSVCPLLLGCVSLSFVVHDDFNVCCIVLQEATEGIKLAAEAYNHTDPVYAGLHWLKGALCTCRMAMRGALQQVHYQQLLLASPSWQEWQQQHLEPLRKDICHLRDQVTKMTQSSLSSVATTDEIMRHIEKVLVCCWVAPGTGSDGPVQSHALQLNGSEQLSPVMENLKAMHRLAVLLTAACCRLLRAQDPAANSNTVYTHRFGKCEQVLQRLGLQLWVAQFPKEASGLRQLIKKMHVQVPYAAESLTHTPWLLLQCSSRVVMGPIALLQGWQTALLAPSCAYASASYLAVRVLDCMQAMQHSLLVGTVPAAGHPAKLASAVHLSPAEVTAVEVMVQVLAKLLQATVTQPVQEALESRRMASEQLEGLKASVGKACEMLQQGRPQLVGFLNQLEVRAELLQKEVLKAETQRVLAAYSEQVAAGQARHQQQLWTMPQQQLWQNAAEGMPALEGRAPNLDVLELWDVCDMASLCKLLQEGAPSGMQGQLLPTSLVVLQWFGQQCITEACLRHGILSQGDLMRSIYDFCPQVLRVGELLEECRTTAAGVLQLLQQPQAAVLAAYSTSKPSGSSAAAPECMRILDKLKCMQEWTLEQVTLVVLAELESLCKALSRHRQVIHDDATQLHNHWDEACTDLLQQRENARREEVGAGRVCVWGGVGGGGGANIRA
jgi:hypothetical protein